MLCRPGTAVLLATRTRIHNYRTPTTQMPNIVEVRSSSQNLFLLKTMLKSWFSIDSKDRLAPHDTVVGIQTRDTKSSTSHDRDYSSSSRRPHTHTSLEGIIGKPLEPNDTSRQPHSGSESFGSQGSPTSLLD